MEFIGILITVAVLVLARVVYERVHRYLNPPNPLEQLQGFMSDVTLIVGGRTIKAQRCVLKEIKAPMLCENNLVVVYTFEAYHVEPWK